MPLPDNTLQTVQTYQMSGLAFFQNLCCFVATANTRFKDFNNFEAQLGATVGFELPPRFTTKNSLVASFEGIEQRVLTLTLDKEISSSYAFSSQELILNVEDYMKRLGTGAIREIGTKIEAEVAKVCLQGYRFYGNGVTPINSYNQLAQMNAQFREYGVAPGRLKAYLSNLTVPSIIANGLNQFANDRNNEIAQSWEVGAFDDTDYYRSNLLPIHTAGTEGQEQSLMTVVSVTANSEGGVTSITFSGADTASDPSSVKENDLFQFNDGVSGQPDLRFKSFVGHHDVDLAVQFRVTADAAATAGSEVTVTIDPPLQAASGRNQNINTEIVAGMQGRFMPSHRAGMLVCDDAFYLAMPRLPDQAPFPTGNAIDPDTGVSIRQTYGTLLGQNTQGFILDALYGYRAVPDYCMRVLFPLTN